MVSAAGFCVVCSTHSVTVSLPSLCVQRCVRDLSHSDDPYIQRRHLDVVFATLTYFMRPEGSDETSNKHSDSSRDEQSDTHTTV